MLIGAWLGFDLLCSSMIAEMKLASSYTSLHPAKMGASPYTRSPPSTVAASSSSVAASSSSVAASSSSVAASSSSVAESNVAPESYAYRQEVIQNFKAVVAEELTRLEIEYHKNQGLAEEYQAKASTAMDHRARWTVIRDQLTTIEDDDLPSDSALKNDLSPVDELFECLSNAAMESARSQSLTNFQLRVKVLAFLLNGMLV